jgi:hypothetical protein
MPLLVLLVVVWGNYTFFLELGFVVNLISLGVSGSFQEFASVCWNRFVPINFPVVDWARNPLLFFHHLLSEAQIFLFVSVTKRHPFLKHFIAWQRITAKAKCRLSTDSFDKILNGHIIPWRKTFPLSFDRPRSLGYSNFTAHNRHSCEVQRPCDLMAPCSIKILLRLLESRRSYRW